MYMQSRRSPINDTGLSTVLTAMLLELDQLRILCDLMAMDESVKLSNQSYHNISTIIMEEVRYGTSAMSVFPVKGTLKIPCLNPDFRAPH